MWLQAPALSALLAIILARFRGTEGQGGAELFFDGVDDFIVAFPDFDVLADWTIEAWVKPSPSSWSARQCLFHQSTYYTSNILTLEAHDYQWRLQYGGHELVVGPPTWGTIPLASAGHFTKDQHHVAITHKDIGGNNVLLAVYLNSTLEASVELPKLEIREPVLPFEVGVCNEVAIDAILRTLPFGGHIDELRYWSEARSQNQIQASMHYTGPASRWPANLLSNSLRAQYSFDQMLDIDIPDTSGQGNNGIRGGWGVTRELPRYQQSIFGSLLNGAEYYELRRQINGTVVSCPSSNCFDLASLLAQHTAFQVLSVPANSDKGVYLALQNGTRLSAGDMIGADTATFLLEAAEVVSYDAFELQLCSNSTAQTCDGQPVHTFTFRVLDSRPPTAGEAYNLQLLGEAGYLELRQGLPESGTVEFWAQLQHLDGEQALFSVSQKDTGMPLVTLGLVDGEMIFHFCTVQQAFGGEKPFTVKMPELSNLDPQHIAISWQYLTSVRGRAVYLIHVFRNCELLRTMPYEVQDACVHFGSRDDQMIEFPTFGQRYQASLQGLVPSAFASAYLADIRVWNHALPSQDICSRQRALLLGSEPGLMALFPIAAEDARRGDTTVANRVAGAASADLRCRVGTRPTNPPSESIEGSDVQQFDCPNMEKLRGYALRPSVFAVPAEPLHLVTSAGRVDGTSFLPPLEVDLPAFDRDNYEDYTLESKGIDKTNILVSRVPRPDCGVLQRRDNSTSIAEGDVVLHEELPLFFTPNRNSGSPNITVDGMACSTSIEYFAIDTDGARSPFSMEIRIAVKVPGPRVTAVEFFDPGITDNLTDAGDIIAFRFDNPTTTVSEWRDLFDVVNGSLGSASINAVWSDSGDVLMLELVSNLQDVDLSPSITQFYFNGNLRTPLQTAGEDSYPCLELSPPAQGSFHSNYCSDGMVFSKQLARCMACGKGNYVSSDGLHCLPCSQGMYAPTATTTVCLPCEPGRYLPPGSTNRSQCLPADPGMYAVDAGQWFQVRCPSGMVSEVPGSAVCYACPAGALCETAAHLHSWAVPMDGHFRFSAAWIPQCLIPTACKGGWDASQQANICEAGMGGPLCHGCLDGWWRAYDKPRGICSECGWAAWGRVFLVVGLSSIGIWILSILCVDAALWGGMHAVIIRLALNYFTAVSLMARLEYWELSPAIGEDKAKTITGILDMSLRFDGGLLADFMGLECLFGKPHISVGQSTTDGQWPIAKNLILFWSVFPVVWASMLLVLSVLVFEAAKCLERSGGRSSVVIDSDENAFKQERRVLGLIRESGFRRRFCDRLCIVIKDSTPLIVTSYFVSLPTLLRELTMALSCEAIGGEEQRWRLLAAPDITCWEGEHLSWAIIAIVAIFLWGCLVPTLMTVLMWVKRENLSGSPRLKTRFGFLCDGYEMRFVHWEGVVQLRRVALILVGIWPELPRTSEFTLYQIVAMAAVLLHIGCKPFDNRGGELLDEIELAGLCLFLLLVTATQLVLLADPDGADYDLIAVMFTGIILSLSVLFLVKKSLDKLLQVCGFSMFSMLMVLCHFGTNLRMIAAAALIAVALGMNLLFILWVLYKVLMESLKFIMESKSRKRLRKGQKEAAVRAGQVALEEEVTRTQSSRLSKAELALQFSKEKPAWEKLLTKVFSSARPSSGALIRFDVETRELVLGLHPDTYMHDPQFSAYTRRLFARLGPFLTDEEREFVAMALSDAIQHVIVGCDYDTISVVLLEFLIRATFAWKYNRRESMGELDELDGKPQSLNWGEDGEKNAPRHSPREAHKDFFERLFDDERIFKHGMSASDFQEELQQITTMKESDVQDLLNAFLERHAKLNSE